MSTASTQRIQYDPTRIAPEFVDEEGKGCLCLHSHASISTIASSSWLDNEELQKIMEDAIVCKAYWDHTVRCGNDDNKFRVLKIAAAVDDEIIRLVRGILLHRATHPEQMIHSECD